MCQEEQFVIQKVQGYQYITEGEDKQNKSESLYQWKQFLNPYLVVCGLKKN